MSMEVNNNSDDYINNNLLLVKKIIDTFNAHNNKLVSNQHNKNTISPYKNDDGATIVEISNAGKELADNANKNFAISAINNILKLNDPIIEYFNQAGTIDKIDPDGTIQWDLSSENTDKMVETIFQNMSQSDYKFWSYLTGEPTFIGLQYSDDEIRNRLIAADIKPGLFEVTLGDKTATHFFSQGKGAAAIYSKEQYDNHYAFITSERYLSRYEVGQKLLIGEKEYTLDENKKINVPYGEDVYNIKIVSK